MHQFPLENNGRLPTKNDIVSLTVAPWKAAFSEENVISGFKKAGIFPLNKEVMLDGVVGDGASTTSDAMEMIVLDEAFTLSDRQKRLLERRGISHGRIRACTIGLMSMVKVKEEKTKKERTFVDGGVLMTSDEMIAAVRAKEELAVEKERIKIEKQREKVEGQMMSLHDPKKRKRAKATSSKRSTTSRKARKVTKEAQKQITSASVAVV